MADAIQRGTSSNLLRDEKLKIGTQFVPPVKDDFTEDENGSMALGNANRVKVKGNDDTVRELANMEDVQASSDGSLPTPSDETFIII